jgi:hypothetical protein
MEPGIPALRKSVQNWWPYAAWLCPSVDRVPVARRAARATEGGWLRAGLCREAQRVDGERKELGRLLKAVRPDDTVVVCRLGRLARSTRDLLNTLDRRRSMRE